MKSYHIKVQNKLIGVEETSQYDKKFFFFNFQPIRAGALSSVAASIAGSISYILGGEGCGRVLTPIYDKTYSNCDYQLS